MKACSCTELLDLAAGLTLSSMAVNSERPCVFIMLLNVSKAACSVRTFFTCTRTTVCLAPSRWQGSSRFLTGVQQLSQVPCRLVCHTACCSSS